MNWNRNWNKGNENRGPQGVRARRLQPWKLAAAMLALLCLFLAGWQGKQARLVWERPKGARQSRSFIARRAAEIGIALNGNARLLNPPTLHSAAIRQSNGAYITRTIWFAQCESEGRQLNLIFNDATGRLSYLMMEGTSCHSTREELLPPVRAASDAIVASSNWLQALGVLAPGARIALNELPQQENRNSAWQANWLVQAPNSPLRRVRVTLDRQTGKPLSVNNLQD